MSAFRWKVSVHRNYCLRPFFHYEGRYFSGAVKVIHIGPLALRFARGGAA